MTMGNPAAGFGFSLPARVIFGRGEADKAPALVAAFGRRVLIVHGRTPARAGALIRGLAALGISTATLPCAAEPTLPLLEEGLREARPFRPDAVVALGGGSVIDMGKALAALIPAPGPPMDHLEVVGRGLPLAAAPLPFVALPTTAGTGAEATRNAVIGLPDHGRKVSIRDERMLPRLAIVDPALTDGCPREVTLASGLDALAQVIEPYVSSRATPFTDAISRPAIGPGLRALVRLMTDEDAAARDTLAWVSLSGGIALANGGLGAVHGLAGVIGGLCPAAHGAICGALLGPVIACNRARAEGAAALRLAEVCDEIGAVLGCSAHEAPMALGSWVRSAGLPGLVAQGLPVPLFRQAAEAALSSSSMKGNPVQLDIDTLEEILRQAA
ncbi:MAG: iron-containing alcohol dehydrogenase [Paracoccaceae bacterium]